MSDNSFFNDVYEVVRLIPKGRISTYGAIANYLGAKGAARTVGWALNLCNAEGLQDVPAHRVLNKQGLLTGKMHFRNTPMEVLLKQDGIDVINNKVQNFEDIFWDPSKELL